MTDGPKRRPGRPKGSKNRKRDDAPKVAAEVRELAAEREAAETGVLPDVGAPAASPAPALDASIPPSIFDRFGTGAPPEAEAAPADAPPKRGPGRPRKSPPTQADGATEFLTSRTGLAVCSDLYALPWGAWADAEGCPAIVPTQDRLERGGEAIQTVLKLYGGEWLKYLPLGHLAVCLGRDFLAARKALAAHKAAKQNPDKGSAS